MKTRIKHPGFKKVAAKIARQKGRNGKPLGKAAAGRILGARTRAASAAARRRNPHLNRVRRTK